MLIIMLIKLTIGILSAKSEVNSNQEAKKNWISVGASIKKNEVDLFNGQLDNLQCKTRSV